jgi:phage gpG-like protein
MARRNLGPLISEHRVKIKKEVKNLLSIAANESVNFFTENFRRQGFLDRSLTKWKKRKKNVDPGRGVLIGKANRGGRGSRLYRSIARGRTTKNEAVIGVKGKAAVYAGVHNAGLRAGRGKGFKMPKRQFIGRSKKLDDKITRLISRRISKIF